MRIALDAMGGDYAPEQVVLGALEAAAMYGCEILLVGDDKELARILKDHPKNSLLDIVPCSQVIGMEETPTDAVRQKPDSSIVVGARLVKEKKADALVSAGSTGAAMVASLLEMKRIKGVERPAISTLLPTRKGACLIVDVGANVDCRPSHLFQFGVMGSIYAQCVLGVVQPRVGLLNMGEEPGKGTEAVKKAHELLQNSSLNFVGNIEGRDIPRGDTDVVVCDGFVGNIVLKLAEGLGDALFGMLKEEFTKNALAKAGALLLRSGFKGVKKRIDYTEYGGAPLLGLKGISIIAHGKSNAKAIRNAIRVAKESVESSLVETLRAALEGDELA